MNLYFAITFFPARSNLTCWESNHLKRRSSHLSSLFSWSHLSKKSHILAYWCFYTLRMLLFSKFPLAQGPFYQNHSYAFSRTATFRFAIFYIEVHRLAQGQKDNEHVHELSVFEFSQRGKLWPRSIFVFTNRIVSLHIGFYLTYCTYTS